MLRALLVVSVLVVAFGLGRMSISCEKPTPRRDVVCVERIENMQFFADGGSYTAPRAFVQFTNGEAGWVRVTPVVVARYEMGERIETQYPYLKTLLENDK